MRLLYTQLIWMRRYSVARHPHSADRRGRARDLLNMDQNVESGARGKATGDADTSFYVHLARR